MKQKVQMAGVVAGVLLMFGVATYAAQVGGSAATVGSRSTVGACSTVGSRSTVGGLSAPSCDTLGGRAYGLSANATVAGVKLLTLNPTPDTGQISTQQNGTFSPPCQTSAALLIASALCSSVTTSNNASTAQASLATLQTAISGIPTITVKLVSAQSSTSCTSSTGSVTIAYLAIGPTVVISKQTTEKPNTSISLAGITIILNQQTPVTGSTHGLTVNGIHIVVALSALVHADVVMASATSTIAGC
jgi:hypothetical protein